MNNNDMYTYIEDEVCRLIDHFDNDFKGLTMYKLSRPEILFAPLTIDAGQCMYTWIEMDYVVGNIIFNLHMIPDNFDKYINVVAPHEVAHWCTAVLNGYLNDDEQNLNHGTTWQSMMAFFDVPPTPHIYDLHAPVVEGMHQFGCKCCTVNLDDEDVEMYELDLTCPNCGCDFKIVGNK